MSPYLASLVGRTILGAPCGVACLLGGFAASAAAPVLPNVRHVVHISADGLGGVYLSNYLAQTPGEFPAFRRLQLEGAGTLNARCDYNISVTLPNHTSMLTGRPVSQQPTNVSFSAPHGITFNYDPGSPWTLHTLGNLNVPYKASTFDVAHDHGLTTAFFAGKDKFNLFLRSYNETNGAPDLVEEDNGTNKIDFAAILDATDPQVFWDQSSNLVTLVTNHLAQALPGYTFLHLADLDTAGHHFGWGSQGYRDTVRHIDDQLARILAVIEASPTLSNHTAIVLTADHGGGDAAGWHVYANDWRVFTIPLVIWGPGIPAGHDLYELFANRTEPGGQYLDYDAPQPPLHNGDSGNLALALLGLPPIPESCLVPEFRSWLLFRRTAAGVLLSWPATDSLVDLERSDLGPGNVWVKVTEGIVRDNGWCTYQVPNVTSAPSQVFRLSRAGRP